ncbi:MAG: hypothetical protein OZ935_15410 [Pseudomonadota bacterium]|nr:hypothetical protein [Pseudomonadota bacterium]
MSNARPSEGTHAAARQGEGSTVNPLSDCGQSSVEYLVILACVVGVMVAVPDGALDDLLAALARAYSRFTEGVSRP